VKEHPEYEKITVLLSGDTGFYSGARRLMEVFASEDVRVLPGISSVSALSAALKTSWEDAPVLSLHGCRQNVVGAVRRSRKVFVLTGGKESFVDLCRDLLRYGLGQVLIEAGCDLSYPQERILRGRPEDFLSGSAAVITGRTDAEKGSPAVSAGGTDAEKGSAVLMITNPAPDRTVSAGLEDSRFSRILAKDCMQEGGKTVPMTKREIRALILSFLQLEKESIIYDVGAGTGSVSIECAIQAESGHVFAIECREDAAELIRKNQRVIGVSNLTVICGSAPEAMEGLPVPDRVFIGGSGGKLEEILQLLCRKNPALRLVISAVTLETLSEALRCLAALLFKEPEIVSITAARARKAGNSHLMTGQNPVYLITAEGRG
jgi:precorrin-6Y C5,15-methyltransferase (decarboxylating)